MIERKNKGSLFYVFHVSLFDIQPMIWRRFRVPSNITFKRFHEVIQIVMGWENYHLYQFKYGPIEVSIPDGEYFLPDETHFDARYKRLSSLNLEMDDVMTYVYDFGDNWAHLLRLEGIYHLSIDDTIRCDDGARACPPEDVGGTHGYELHMNALLDENDAEHESALQWRGQYDAEFFDLASVNQELARTFKRRKK